MVHNGNVSYGNPEGCSCTANDTLVVTKEGDKLETKYTVMPSPQKPLDEGIQQLYKDMKINLDALYDGADPFSSATTEPDVDVDNVSEALGAKKK